MPAAVIVADLVKRYGAHAALSGISFAIEPGEIFGLLGPNAAGKTTTLECLIGLRRPDAGTLSVFGLDPGRESRAVRERIGVQLTALPDRIRVHEALQMFAGFYRRRADIPALLERVALTDRAQHRFAILSAGQRQRLAIALALVNEPELVLLDEPSAGLDAHARRDLHALVRGLKHDGRTVLLTTHHIDEAESLCDRVAIIDCGRIVAVGVPRELVASSGLPSRVAFSANRPLDDQVLRALPGVCALDADGLCSDRVHATVAALVRAIETAGGELTALSVRAPSLEDVFVALTSRKDRS